MMKSFASLVTKITFASLAVLFLSVLTTTSASALTIGEAAASTTCLPGKTGGCVVNIPVNGVDVPWLISNYTDGGYVQLMAMTNLCSISAVGCKDSEGTISTTGTAWNADGSSLSCDYTSGYCNQLTYSKTYNYLTQMNKIYNLLPAQFGTTAKASAVRSTTWDMDGFTNASPAVRSDAYNTNVTEQVNLVSFYEWNEGKDDGNSAPTTGHTTEPLHNSMGDLFCMSRYGAEACIGTNLYSTYSVPWTRSAHSGSSDVVWDLLGYEPYSLNFNAAYLNYGLLPTMWVADDINLYGSPGAYTNPYSLTFVNSAPSIVILDPSNNNYYSANFSYSDINIIGTVSDSDNDNQTVSYKIDSGSWNTLATVTGMMNGSQAYSGSVDVSALSEGDHTIYIKSNDGTVDSGEESVIIKMDKSLTTATISIGLANPTVTNAMPTVTYSAADSGAGIANWQLQMRSAVLTSGSCGAYGSWEAVDSGTTTALSAQYQTVMNTGNCYQYQIAAVDAVNNYNVTAATNTIVYDIVAPTCSTWSPANSAWHESGGTTFRLTCSDGTTGASGLSATPLSGTQVSAGVYSCTTGTGHGATCRIWIKDLAGNVSSTYVSPHNNVDGETPDLEISDGSGDWFNVDRRATITAEALSLITAIRYEFVTGANPVTTLAADCLSGGTLVASGAQTDNAPPGGATLFTCARSVSGLVATSSDTFNVDKTTPTCGTWNTSLLSNTTPVIMTLSSSSDAGGSGLDTAMSEKECEVATNGATCSVTLYDNAGNEKECTSQVALINSQPAAPVIVSPNAVDEYVDSLVLKITGSDPDGDNLVGWYKIDNGSYIQIGDSAFVSGNGTNKLINIGVLEDGEHTVTVKTVDTNNFASSEVSQVFNKYAAQVLMPSNNLDQNGTELVNNIIMIDESAQASLSGTLGTGGAAIDYEVCLTINNTNINKCVMVTNDPTQDTHYDLALSGADFPKGQDVFIGSALSTRDTITEQTVTIPVNIVFHIKRNVSGYNINEAYQYKDCAMGIGNCVIMRDFKGWN